MGDGINLIQHARGGYYVKFRGKMVSLGCKGEPDKARIVAAQKIADLSRELPALPAVPADEITVGQLVNRYARERRADRDAGRLSKGACDDYEEAGIAMVKAVGRDLRVSDLRPDHFTAFYRQLSSRLKEHALARNIQAVRTMFNQAYQQNWIGLPPRYGMTFRKPALTRRQDSISPEEWCKCYMVSAGQVHAMLLLALNCAYTGRDVSALPRKSVDLRNGVIVFPRPKMARRRGIERAAPLWPETTDALDRVMQTRPHDELVFRTVWGNPWVRGEIDSLNQELGKVCKAAGIPKRGFALIRHLFSTIADEVGDRNGKARIMGHRLPGMDDVYIDRIEHSRLQRITDHVRSRVLTCPLPSRTPQAPA